MIHSSFFLIFRNQFLCNKLDHFTKKIFMTLNLPHHITVLEALQKNQFIRKHFGAPLTLIYIFLIFFEKKSLTQK